MRDIDEFMAELKGPRDTADDMVHHSEMLISFARVGDKPAR